MRYLIEIKKKNMHSPEALKMIKSSGGGEGGGGGLTRFSHLCAKRQKY